jgi:hypothetical protein
MSTASNGPPPACAPSQYDATTLSRCDNVEGGAQDVRVTQSLQLAQ